MNTNEGGDLDVLNFYTKAEDRANVLTHVIGLLLCLAAPIRLFRAPASAQGSQSRIALLIYTLSLISVYLTSLIYHSAKTAQKRKWLRIVDHAAIYVLIAGTYTPYLLIAFRGHHEWLWFAGIWLAALIGIVYKLFFLGKYEKLALAGYILMGWIGVFMLPVALQTIPGAGLFWLVVGGVLYTGGVYFFVRDHMPYNHAIWHLFVMGGSLAHFLSIITFVPS